MMQMTLRQIRAYLHASIRLRALEALEGSVVSGLYTMPQEAVTRITDAWRVAADEKPIAKGVGGQGVERVGQWRIVEFDQVERFLRGG